MVLFSRQSWPGSYTSTTITIGDGDYGNPKYYMVIGLDS